MDPEIKAKWIAALRSGKYPQAKAALRTDVGYCCLGVLCDVVRPNGWSQPFAQPEWKHLGEYSAPDPSIGVEIELSSLSQEWLVHLNDAAGKSFAEIADYIEQSL